MYYSTKDPKKIFSRLIAMELILVFIYVMIHILLPNMHWGPARELFDLDGEACIPAWFSSIQLFIVAFMLFGASRNNQRKQHVSSSLLIAGSLFFIFLSADESASIHEKITIIVHQLEIYWPLFTGGHGAWITAYFILALAVVLIAGRHLHLLWRYFRRETHIAIFGAIIFVMGGIGFEIIGYLFLRSGLTPNLYKMAVACEEFLEMSGISLILYAVLLLSININSKIPISVAGEITEAVQPSGRGELMKINAGQLINAERF